MDLDKIFQNKNYQVNWFPSKENSFRYVVVDNIFTKSLKEKLNNYYLTKLDDNLFVPFPHYDCDVMTIDPREKNNPFDFVFSLEWKDFISNMFDDIPITNNMIAELQHHDIGTSNGWIHNDYDASHFLHEPLENEINPWYHQCNYRQSEPDKDLITNVRSIVAMYHINDKYTYQDDFKREWEEGDGGETAFYDYNDSDVMEETVIKINPYPNRLVVYEINPWSFHTFLSNIKHSRATMNMWYHSTVEDTYETYGWTDVNIYKSHSSYQDVNNRRNLTDEQKSNIQVFNTK